MNRFALLLAPLALSSCATLTPDRCADALRAAQTIEQIAAVLIANGIAVEQAAKVAEAVALGQVAVGVACAVAREQ